MDQDKTTVMAGYGSAQAGDSADATRVVPNPGYTDPAATQPFAEPTGVMGYGDTAQDSYAASSQGPYGNAAPDPFDYAPQDFMPPRRRIPTDALPQNPFRSLSRRRGYASHGAASLRVARRPYREYPKSIPQYGEDEMKKPSRSSSVTQENPDCAGDLLCFIPVVFAIVSGMLNRAGAD